MNAYVSVGKPFLAISQKSLKFKRQIYNTVIMGQLSCQCHEDPSLLTMQTTVPNKPNPRKPRHRVKSILQPKQLNWQHRKCQSSNFKQLASYGQGELGATISLPTQSDQEQPFPSSEFSQVTISSQICQIGIQVRSRISTIGTEGAQVSFPMVRQDDLFRMHLKYENQGIFVKDAGIGFGVFLLKKSYEFKPETVLVVNWNTYFIVFESDGDLVEWRLWGKGGVFQTGSFNSKTQESVKIKSFQITTDKFTEKKRICHQDSKENIFVYCQNFEKVNENDILRCGLSLYIIDRIQHYIETSRVVQKF